MFSLTQVFEDFEENSDQLFENMVFIIRNIAPICLTQPAINEFRKICIMRIGASKDNLTNGYISRTQEVINSLDNLTRNFAIDVGCDDDKSDYIDGLRSLKYEMLNSDVKEVFFILSTNLEDIPKTFFKNFDLNKKIAVILNYFGDESEEKLEEWKERMPVSSTYIKYEKDLSKSDFVETIESINILNFPKPKIKLVRKGYDRLVLKVDIKGERKDILKEVILKYSKKESEDKLREMIVKNFDNIEIINLEANTQYDFICKLKFHGSSESLWSDKIDFQTLMKHPFNDIINSPKLGETVANMLRNLKEFTLPETISDSKLLEIEKLNILLLGKTGAGKSSFLNTVSGIFSGKFIQIAPTASFEYTFTNELKKYEISVSLNIWDIFGAENNNYEENFLRKLLRGKLYNVKETSGETTFNEIMETETVLQNLMHGVILIIDVNTLTNDMVTKKNQEILKIVREYNIPVQIMLTKMDKLSNELVGFNPKKLYWDPNVLAKIELCAQIYSTLVDSISIFPFKNQTSAIETRDYAIDFIALKAIRAMADQIIGIIMSEYKIVNVIDYMTMDAVDKIVVNNLAMSLGDFSKVLQTSDRLKNIHFTLISDFCDFTITKDIILSNILEPSEDISKADFKVYVALARGHQSKSVDISTRKIPELEIYSKKRGDTKFTKETSIREKIYFDVCLARLQSFILNELDFDPEKLSLQFLSPKDTYIQNKNRVKVQDIYYLSDDKKPSICIEYGDIYINFRLENKEDPKQIIEQFPLNINSKLKDARIEIKATKIEVNAFYLKMNDEFYPISKQDEDDFSVIELSYFDHKTSRYIIFYEGF